MERELSLISAPRTGRILLRSFDNAQFYKKGKVAPYKIFASGGVCAFGVWFRAAEVRELRSNENTEPFDPESTIELPLENFLNQRVLCVEGQWITRRAVIKYCANIGSGVHSGEAKTDEEKAIALLRRSMTYRVELDSPHGPAAGMILHGPANPASPTAVDAVLIELLATTDLIVKSEGVVALEKVVQQEIALGESSAYG